MAAEAADGNPSWVTGGAIIAFIAAVGLAIAMGVPLTLTNIGLAVGLLAVFLLIINI